MADDSVKASPGYPRLLPCMAYGVMLVFVFAIPGLRQFTDAENRVHWSLSIHMVLAHYLLIAFVGAAGGIAWHGLMRASSGRAGLRRFLIALLVGSTLAAGGTILFIKLAVRIEQPMGLDGLGNWLLAGEGADWVTLAFALALVPLLYVWQALARLAGRLLRLGAKLISPLPVLLLITLATYPQHRLEYQDPPPAPAAAAVPAPVIMVVLDALDRERSIDDPAAMARLPVLSRLAAEGCVFSDTESPYHRTLYSMPAILHQDERTHWAGPNRLVVTTEAGDTPVSEVPTWFDLVGRDGDVRVMSGFHLDFSAIIGGRVDWLQTRGVFYAGLHEGPGWFMRSHLALYAGPTRVPCATRSAWVREFYPDRLVDITADVHHSARYAIDAYGPSLVAVFHYVPPHPPWIFDRNGPRRHPPDLDENEGYLQNLEYADFLVGELITDLEQRNLWDSATFIVTSDHGYPFRDASRRPPIFIKLPGQTTGRMIHGRRSTTRIAEWLHQQPEFTALRPPKVGQD